MNVIRKRGDEMGMEYCAYSFLKEEGSMCDYEIATDRLASSLGAVRHFVKHVEQSDLQSLIELVYHANGSIRGKNAIGENEIAYLHTLYEKYFIELHQFVVPDGCIGASHLHVLRADCKAVIRIMTKIKQEGHAVPDVLWDFMNLLSNTLFMMCLYENKHDTYMERAFISRSYES